MLKHPISPKDPTENSLIFVTKRRPFLFLVDFVTERPLLFKCPMYVSLYKSCAPGYLHPLSILSQSTSVSPTDILPRSIMQGQRRSGTRRAVCTQSLPRQLYSRTHNARLKFRNKWTRPVATGLQNLSNGQFFTVFLVNNSNFFVIFMPILPKNMSPIQTDLVFLLVKIENNFRFLR